jgi:hypothetical protein
MASNTVPLHQVEQGFDCTSTDLRVQRPQRKSMLRRGVNTVVIGTVVGTLCFFIVEYCATNHAQGRSIISFDLGCIKEHLSVHDGGVSMITDCEVKSQGGKALAKYMTAPIHSPTMQKLRMQPSVMVQKESDKFKVPNPFANLPAAATAAAIAAHAEAAHAKSVLGVNGALDFGPLAGDQPGGEGTGKALGINDDSLGAVLLIVVVIIGYLFAQWQSYQDDDDDFFDTYDSRRDDRDLTNRNRV